jgi:hypothetical protein
VRTDLGYEDVASYETVVPGSPSVYVTADLGGHVWVADGDGTLRSIHAGRKQVTSTHRPPRDGALARGLAADASGALWMGLVPGGSMARFSNSDVWEVFPVDRGQVDPYSMFAAPPPESYSGRIAWWKYLVDSGHATTRWTSLEFASTEPPETRLAVAARFTDDPTDTGVPGEKPELPTCAFGEAESPIDLTTCPPAGRARYAIVSMSLSSMRTGVPVVVSSIRLRWTRP